MLITRTTDTLTWRQRKHFLYLVLSYSYLTLLCVDRVFAWHWVCGLNRQVLDLAGNALSPLRSQGKESSERNSQLNPWPARTEHSHDFLEHGDLAALLCFI